MPQQDLVHLFVGPLFRRHKSLIDGGAAERGEEKGEEGTGLPDESTNGGSRRLDNGCTCSKYQDVTFLLGIMIRSPEKQVTNQPSSWAIPDFNSYVSPQPRPAGVHGHWEEELEPARHKKYCRVVFLFTKISGKQFYQACQVRGKERACHQDREDILDEILPDSRPMDISKRNTKQPSPR